MNTNQPKDRVEIVFRTDAKLDDQEIARYEKQIREALDSGGLEVSDLSFREGSTIITIVVALGLGLGFCFSHLLSGALQKVGEKLGEAMTERGAKLLNDKLDKESTNDTQPTTTKALQISEHYAVGLLSKEEHLVTNWSIEAKVMMISTETTRILLAEIFKDLPGKEKSVKLLSATYNLETQELVEDIIQHKVTKL